MYAYAALAALQVVGGYQNADIIRQNGDLQSSINDFNAKYAEQGAFNEEAAGYGTAARYQATVNQTIGAERGKYASEGVSIGYGTAAQKDAGNHIAGIMNTLQLQRQARDSAMGYQTQAINMRLGSSMIQLNSSLKAGQAQLSGLEAGASTAVAGYTRSLSTGTGQTGKTGTNDQAWKLDSTNFTISSDGSSFAPNMFNSGGWTPMAAQGNEYWANSPSLGNYSFTAEAQ